MSYTLPDLLPESFTLSPDQLKTIIDYVVRDAYSALHWEEHIDWPVLNLRIARYISTGSFSK